jgi:transcriptional regulator with XRE-family HTH domain
MELGQALKNTREKMGLPLQDAAYGIGISTGYLSNIEAGRKVPTLNILYMIARHYDTKLYLIFKQLDK